jgi:Protein of unknown function (DUF4232)
MARPSVLALLAAVPAAALVGCSSDDRPVVSVSDPRSARSASPTATATPSTSAAPSAGATPSAPAAPGPGTTADGSPPPPAASPARPADPLAPAPAQESAAPTGQPPCRATDLTVVDADTLVLPQTVHEVFVLRTSGPDCQLEGYPSVRLLDASGAPLRIPVTSGGQDLPATGPVPVTLSRGTSLSFVVATPRDGTCVEASAVDVTLPGTTTALRAPTALSVCGSAGVSPVERRTDDE